MSLVKQKLSMDQPVKYQIKVPGHLDEGLLVCYENVIVTLGVGKNDLPNTTLTVTVDQAALHGFLRRLYSLGLPLISVNIVYDP